ncbi:MAG: hypothetical protein N3B18_05165, partial [Desulfobacterota bacterium]|nr:hypothetical protein [Thermodesulfobacteriota bacterium]
MPRISMIRIGLLFILTIAVPASYATAACPTGGIDCAADAAADVVTMLFEHDAAATSMLERLHDKNLIPWSPAYFKQRITDSLIEMSESEVPDIAPGCLLPYTIAAATLLTYTPTMFILFLNEITNGDEECALMYGSWSIAGICFALTSWTQYRICAEQGKETPDPTVLERLQNDLTTMGIGTL